MYETIAVAKQGPITTLTLRERTMRGIFFAEIGEAFGAIADDPEVRAVIVEGEGKCFTYGLDLPDAAQTMGDAFAGGGAATRTELWRTIHRLQRAFNAIEECPVPVIAAVHGWCIGGGVDLICAADLRLASADARFSVRETKIAIVADLGTLQRLPRIVGPGHARELAFTGKDIPAARAATIGLVNDVLPDHDALRAAARALAEEIAANPPLTVRGTKEVMRFSEGKDPREGLAYVAAWNSAFLASEDLGEAVSAFFGKRPPSFKGR
ncbi:MAG: crotonase/enoyl-CoA hydratase family protein [Myxococcales bacterium]|nr:crotonase/enoyl-CoA hydratase family protein [Myxococcales bacterium]MCB9704954.1 crotonase/enoyl-CoA hydratase family protein [Myxococcales bacterium]